MENWRLKGVNTINDSILRLPSACFVDIQSAKQQREAVHKATADVIEQLAEEKVRSREDGLMNSLMEQEERVKKAYLD